MKQTLEMMVMVPVSPQPKWDKDEPTKITDIVGGFKDGKGKNHPVPSQYKSHGTINAVKAMDGTWMWEALP